MLNLKQQAMTEGYGGKTRNITFRVSKVLRTRNEVVSFLTQYPVTREIENFVADQRDVLGILRSLQGYFGDDLVNYQLLDNKIRVIVNNDGDTDIFEFFVEKVTVEKVKLIDIYRN